VDSENAGDLGDAPVEHIVEDQRGALAPRQHLHDAHEREPDALAQRTACSGPGTAGNSASGYGSSHRMSERGAVVGGPGAIDGPTSWGSTRRERALSMSRQVFVTIRYIHARSSRAARRSRALAHA